MNQRNIITSLKGFPELCLIAIPRLVQIIGTPNALQFSATVRGFAAGLLAWMRAFPYVRIFVDYRSKPIDNILRSNCRGSSYGGGDSFKSIQVSKEFVFTSKVSAAGNR
jgi:hypothetical protein